MTEINKIGILGGGNLGRAIARGLVASGSFDPGHVAITRRRWELLADLDDEGFFTHRDNRSAVEGADVVILCVQPQQMEALLDGVASALVPGKHVVISTATGVTRCMPRLAQRTRSSRLPVSPARSKPHRNEATCSMP